MMGGNRGKRSWRNYAGTIPISSTTKEGKGSVLELNMSKEGRKLRDWKKKGRPDHKLREKKSLNQI